MTSRSQEVGKPLGFHDIKTIPVGSERKRQDDKGVLSKIKDLIIEIKKDIKEEEKEKVMLPDMLTQIRRVNVDPNRFGSRRDLIGDIGGEEEK